MYTRRKCIMEEQMYNGGANGLWKDEIGYGRKNWTIEGRYGLWKEERE